MKKSAPYIQYARNSEIKTSFERQIERIQQDPIRFLEGENDRVSLRTVKAVRLG
ncbi:hypothetical protein V7114_06920 [Neobacillus niacini]|uniref:hypothetical protein n=1 Tax=Neobacillus niacini TaxID=86668 RepID=UPI002FFFF56F